MLGGQRTLTKCSRLYIDNAHLRVVFRSEMQSHFFNCPYQLSSSDVRDATNLAGIMKLTDNVAVDVQELDIVLGCTDGVLDNLNHEQV